MKGVEDTERGKIGLPDHVSDPIFNREFYGNRVSRAIDDYRS